MTLDGKKQDDFQKANEGIMEYFEHLKEKRLEQMNKEDRVEMKKRFVDHLNTRNAIYLEFQEKMNWINTYNKNHYGSQRLELNFWDESIVC